MRIQIKTNIAGIFTDTAALPNGVTVELPDGDSARLIGEAVLSAVLSIPAGVAASLVASWIQEKIKKSEKSDVVFRLGSDYLDSDDLEAITRAIQHAIDTDTHE